MSITSSLINKERYSTFHLPEFHQPIPPSSQNEKKKRQKGAREKLEATQLPRGLDFSKKQKTRGLDARNPCQGIGYLWHMGLLVVN
jgi:hypothetical protein